MNVNIAPRGHSTKAVTAYLMNPKRDDPEQLERVGNTETFNLYTDDIEKAAGWMAWVDGNRDLIKAQNGGDGRGRPATAGNVYHMSLSWRPDDQPSWEHMRETALSAMEVRGLSEHQFYLVEHTETDHRHVHIVANLVHPETGKIDNCYRDRDALDAWANEYEKEHGIQCENRAAKYEAWEQDREAFPKREKLDHSEAVTTAFERSDSGAAFQAALADEGLELARGKRRAFVVVDGNGDVRNLTKCIDFTDGTKGRAKTAKIREHLKDIAPDDLQDADTLAAQRLAEMERQEERGDGDGEDERQAGLDAGAAASKQHQEDTSDDTPALQATEENTVFPDSRAGFEKPKDQGNEERSEDEKSRRLEEAAARKKERALEQHRRWERFQADVARKTEDSRTRWQLDEFASKKQQAQERADSLSGFWSRVFKPFQRRDALDQLNNATLQLQERTARFEADVEAFKLEAPERTQTHEMAAPVRAEPKIETKPEPEPQKQEPPSPTAQEKPQELTAEQQRAAAKQEFLDRQREERENQRDEPEQRPELERD